MAVMFPDTRKTRVIFSSSAEERFYKACQQELSDAWRVYSSCTLSEIEGLDGLKDNEIDFVLYHPGYGVLVIEVKGGRIAFEADQGDFYSVNRHNRRFHIKNPFQQVLTWKSRFLRYLKKQGVRCPVSHGVSFPAVMESDFPSTAELSPELIIGKKSFEKFEESLIRIIRISQPEKYLKFADVSEGLHEVLRGSRFETPLYLRDYLDLHEGQVKDVETIHDTLVNPIAGSRRMAVEGEAGTGKTLLALMLAARFRSEGKSVILLSSNPLLNNRLRDDAGEGIRVMTYGELASGYGVELLRRPSGYEGTREDWTQLEGPERLKNAISDSKVRYDVLLCDEAQDVQPFWWEALESVLTPGEESRFYIFFDRSQGVFGSLGKEDCFEPEDVLPMPPPYFCLLHNYRTTSEIGRFARAFRTGKEILQSHSNRLGYRPEMIVYEDEADCQKKLQELFNRLFVREGLKTGEVTLLSGRIPGGKDSVFEGVKSIGPWGLMDLGHRKNRRLPTAKELESKVQISTIQGYKGLEAPVGIITNLSEYNMPLTNPIMASLFYVACTRARHMLYVMVRKGDSKLEMIRRALGELETRGSFVVDRNRDLSTYEICGTVTYYNPQRVGWLKVDDPKFKKSAVMFFPHDVETSRLGGIKVGEKLMFRPRLEGQTTIACELKKPA